jgi:hypothetical protein
MQDEGAVEVGAVKMAKILASVYYAEDEGWTRE